MAKVARPPPAGVHLLGNPLGDRLGLDLLRCVGHEPDRLPLVVLGEQPLLLAADVVRDQMVGHAENPLRAAIVLLEPHDADLGIILLEIENVAEIRPAPAVDRLVRIAGDRQVRMVVRQRPDDRVLGQVRVLILIDQDVAIAVVEPGPQLGIVAQQRGDVQQQVVEIDRAGRQQPRLIGRIDLGHDAAERVAGAGRVFVGRDQLVLGPTDRGGDPLRREMGQIVRQGVERVLQSPVAVVGVVDRIVFAQADQRGVLPQQPGAEAMERAQPDRRAGAKSATRRFISSAALFVNVSARI